MKTTGIYNQKILKYLDKILQTIDGIVINPLNTKQGGMVFEVIVQHKQVQWAYREADLYKIMRQLMFDLGLLTEKDLRFVEFKPSLLKWDWVKKEYIGGVEV